MTFVSFLVAVSVKATGLAALAGLVLELLRVKSPALRHAAWTVVTGGMLAIAGASAVLPSMPVRVLRPRPAPPIAAAPLPAIPGQSIAAPPPAHPSPWEALYAAGLLLFAGRLAYGYLLTRRLVRSSEPEPTLPGVRISASLSVPVTVGWLRPAILLPPDWRQWMPEKLDAVLQHERVHIRRADWAIALLAGINRCIFWFHPLAWWLEARLNTLAEEACDDACVATVRSRESYAQVLIEMAAAVRRAEGRLAGEAMAMARSTEVRMRVERILDETRQIFPPLTGARWIVLALCAAPIVYMTAVLRPARAQAQSASQVVPASEPQHQSSDRELEIARANLASLEQQITKFKSENMGRLPEQFQANVAQLQSLEAQLAGANEGMGRLQQDKLLLETQLQNLYSQRSYYESQLTLGDAKLRQLNQRLEDTRSQIAAAVETYTEDHPLVRSLRERYVALQRDRDTELGEPARKMLLDLDGAIAMVKTQIQNANISMAEKLTQVQHLNGTIAQYQRRIESSPQLEQQYAALLRNLEIARERVADLAQRPSGLATGPRLISRHDPDYTQEARDARIEGTVELSVTIGADGTPSDIQVTRGLDAGLDQKAIECVKTWRFQPATRNGQPVTAFVSAEVRFRLQ